MKGDDPRAGGTGVPAGVPEASEVPDDPRLVAIVQEYLRQLEAGQRPSRQELLSRHADLAGPLAACLDGLELVHGASLRHRPTLGGYAGPVDEGKDAVPAEPLGDFKIVKEIGRGGMGVVYEAVQLSLGRRVALKVLPFAATFDARHLQRFHNEAHAAAQLHHTNIVPVYSVGSERGVHFYAMQLIEGPSLADVIRQVRMGDSPLSDCGLRLAEAPIAEAPIADCGLRIADSRWRMKVEAESNAGAFASNPQSAIHNPQSAIHNPQSTTHPLQSEVSRVLSTQRAGRREAFFRTAARYMIQAAEALEHAHQMGIIHRDVKPANLLIDRQGRVWVTDFGLAQLPADMGVTQTGDILGTLRYASPEQTSGQRVLLDHRTDVYSLGASLYELITLEPLFAGRSRQELLDQIAHEEPRAPRALDPRIPVELETIILKAISKSPADRYGSAQEMADDLERYLQDKPIRARRPGLVERARKWGRRHPSLIAAAIVVLLLCVAGLIVNNRMIASEQQRTQKALERAEHAAERERERLRLAQRAVDELTRIGLEELAEQPFQEGLRKRILESALGYYKDLLDSYPRDSAEQEKLLDTKARMEKIVGDLVAIQGAGYLRLLEQNAVAEDLLLSDEQRTRLKEVAGPIHRKWWELFGQMGKLSPDVRSRRFLEQARSEYAAVTEVLRPEQVRRLRQIVLQVQGPGAFRGADVVAALKLTAGQRRRIRTIETETFFPPDDHHKRRSHEEVRRDQEARRQAALKRAVAVLAPEQAKTWRELTGPAFQGHVVGFFPGLGLGPPPGGPRPGGPRPGGRPGPPPPGPPSGQPQ